MALTFEEKQKVKELKAQGYSNQHIAGFIGGERTNRPSTVSIINEGEAQAQAAQLAQPKKVGLIDRAKETFGDIKQIGTEIKGAEASFLDREADILQGEANGEQGFLRTVGQSTANIVGTGGEIAGSVFKGTAKVFTSQETEDKLLGIVSKKAQKAMEIPEVQQWMQNFADLEREDPALARDVVAVAKGGAFLLEFFGLKTAAELAMETARIGVQGSKAVAKEAFSSFDDVAKPVVSTAKTATKEAGTKSKGAFTAGLQQKAKEMVDRIPRAIEKIKEAGLEASEKATRIEVSTPAVANALEVGLDERIINTVLTADDATKAAYKEMVEIAENPAKTLKQTKRVEEVAGDAAEGQYKIIDAQRNKVGQQIGEETKKLSKTGEVNLSGDIAALDEMLGANGITTNAKGQITTKDSFAGTRFTPSQRTKIVELHDLVIEGGAELTPNQIYRKNKLLSELQREARFEGIGNIFIETTDGDKNLFGVFRDVFSNKLNELSPEIAALNKEYTSLIRLTNDIDDSILRSGSFEASKGLKPSEVAKINLRRLASDAQSQPAYEAIVRQMDGLARELGYEGANPEDLILFALELRKLYPNTIPNASFQGGIRTSLKGVAEKVLNFGAPDIADQKAALQQLVNSK